MLSFVGPAGKTTTLGQVGRAKLARLCEAIGQSHLTQSALGTFECLATSWADRSIGSDSWASDITDDATPFEFSLAFEGSTPEIRILVEAQGNAPSLAEQWNAGLRLNQQLMTRFGLHAERFERVAELFAPTAGDSGSFALWHGVTIRGGDNAPDFKIYLNPQLRGPTGAVSRILEALERLEFEHAIDFVRAYCESDAHASPRYFSLDVSASPRARVKIYFAHEQRVHAQRLLSKCSNVRPADVDEWCNAFVGKQGQFDRRPVLSCLGFTSQSEKVEGTLHLPVRSYVANDDIVAQRVGQVLGEGSASVYLSALSAIATRPLARRSGLQTYVSIRRVAEIPRITVYLAPEAYSESSSIAEIENVLITERGGLMSTMSPKPERSRDVVRYFEEVEPITHHKFFARMQSEEPNLRHLWKLLANFHISISKNFAQRLASIAGRVEDGRIRCILAEQLNDEMGNGKFERAHINLFASMMSTLNPWAPEKSEALLAPGRTLDVKLAEIYGAPDLNVALGAVMAGEVFGKQMDQRLADEFRRQSDVDLKSLEWLTLHEELEAHHADSSTVLADLLPTAAVESVWSGAHALAQAGSGFLDDLYTLCYEAE
jgi:hypothetical protein